MGTRSITTVIEKGNWEGKDWKQKLITMYRQMDGYPEGMGSDLAEFLSSGEMVNGLSLGRNNIVFNGAGCLAAQLVAFFKEGPGSYYMVRAGSINHGENYRYEVIIDGLGPIIMKCIEVGYMNKQDKYVNRARTIFEGEPKDFEAWLEVYTEKV